MADAEAASRIARYGFNELPSSKPRSIALKPGSSDEGPGAPVQMTDPAQPRKIRTEATTLKEAHMNVTLPDSLKEFVEKQVKTGRYANPDAFVTELVRTESEMFERVSCGEALPIDEHFDRRLESLLDEGEKSGDYVEAAKGDFDAMEREAQELLRKRKSS
jgi:antitoxin ParD1/3/4